MEAQSEKAFIKELLFGALCSDFFQMQEEETFSMLCFPLRSMGFLRLLYIHSEENLISVMFFFK